MTKITYNTNTTAANYMLECVALDPQQLTTILQSVIIDCETPQLQEDTIWQYKNTLYGRLDKYSKGGVMLAETSGKMKDSNSPVAKFAEELLKDTFVYKYKIVELFTFYKNKEIWAISEKVDLLLNAAFDEETFKLSKETGIEVIPMLIEKSELDYEEMPKEYDDHIEVK